MGEASDFTLTAMTSSSNRRTFLTSIFASAEITSHTIQALNMPGFIVEVPTEHTSRGLITQAHPMSFNQWRALVLPVSLPFWWLAGIGIDALTTRHRQPWWVLLSSIVWVLAGVIETGLWFGISKSIETASSFPMWDPQSGSLQRLPDHLGEAGDYLAPNENKPPRSPVRRAAITSETSATPSSRKPAPASSHPTHAASPSCCRSPAAETAPPTVPQTAMHVPS